jgi:hypothetical protein
MILTKKKIATTTVTAIETVIETGTRGAIETATATVNATEIGTATEGTLVSPSPSYKLSLNPLIIPDNLLFVLSSQLEAGVVVVLVVLVVIIGSLKTVSAAIVTCVPTFSQVLHTDAILYPPPSLRHP